MNFVIKKFIAIRPLKMKTWMFEHYDLMDLTEQGTKFF